jgi:trehalose/maltose hydrolase-like predicted phosphorylase
MSFSPTIPQKWNSYIFKINFRGRTLQLCINKRNIEVRLIKGPSLKIKVYEKEYILAENNPAIISTIIKNQ